MKNINEWTLLELIEFLNTYSRNEYKGEALTGLYKQALQELHNRSSLLAMVY